MDFVVPMVDLGSIAPALMVLVTALLVLVGELFTAPGRKGALAVLALLGVSGAMAKSLLLWGRSRAAFGGMVALDNYGLLFGLIFLLALGMTVLLSVRYLDQMDMDHGEYYALLLLAAFGMMLMASGTDLIVIFLGLEILSLSLYVLAGFARTDLRAQEAALKYFLLGAFSSGFLLYGAALTYAATGTTNLARIVGFLAQAGAAGNPLLWIAMGLLIVGFGFKVATVPFQMWVPDVYQGAPTPVTAFMSVGAKAAGFAGFLRVFLYAFPALSVDWTWLLAALAVVTMTLGNVVAIAQGDIKRMLAYSSIAHAGYLLVAMASNSQAGVSAVLFYLVAYAFTNLGAFAVVVYLARQGQEALELSDYAGLCSRAPLVALAMTIFMVSLAGVPPTAGFVAKFYLFGAAVEAGLAWLAVIGVLNSVISAYYYLRLIVIMYMREPVLEAAPASTAPLVSVSLAIAATATLLLGLLPSALLALAQSTVGAIFKI